MSFKVETVVEIPIDRVADLICNGVETGYSSHWFGDVEYIEGKPEDLIEVGGYNKYVTYPLSPGYELHITDAEDGEEVYVLNLEKIEKGLKLMASNHRNFFNDFINENDDAETADVFLQLACLGEIVFG